MSVRRLVTMLLVVSLWIGLFARVSTPVYAQACGGDCSVVQCYIHICDDPDVNKCYDEPVSCTQCGGNGCEYVQCPSGYYHAPNDPYGVCRAIGDFEQCTGECRQGSACGVGYSAAGGCSGSGPGGGCKSNQVCCAANSCGGGGGMSLLPARHPLIPPCSNVRILDFSRRPRPRTTSVIAWRSVPSRLCQWDDDPLL